MRHIYIGKRMLSFEQNNIELQEHEIKGIAAGFRDGTDNTVLACNNPEEAYRAVCSDFREVNAAGGLVRNSAGKYLMIRRSGLWDIPKGHQEKGEDIRTTAVREVEEETGVSGLIPGDLVCITDHCYVRDGIWHLKHTWWYRMEYEGNAPTVPQTEEEISEAVWVEVENLKGIAEETYPSIAEVIEKFLN